MIRRLKRRTKRRTRFRRAPQVALYFSDQPASVVVTGPYAFTDLNAPIDFSHGSAILSWSVLRSERR